MALWRPDAGEVFTAQFDRLPADARGEVQRIINLLCIDPFADGEHKKIIRTGPDGVMLYYDAGWLWVTYKIMGNDEFHLLSCGRMAHR